MVGMVSDWRSVPKDCGAGAVTTLLVSFVLQLQLDCPSQIYVE